VTPGTASTADFVGRAFAAPLAALGIGLVSGDAPTDPAALDEAVARYRPVLVGGVSIGAHLAVRCLSRGRWKHRPDGLLLAMPAWTGPPGPVAAASGLTADEIDRDGVRPALDRIRAGASPDAAWVVEELATAWPGFPPGRLAATLRATSASPGPSLAELSAVTVPCGVAVLRDDPLHPAAVGRSWTTALPCAALVETRLAAVGADREALGRAAVLAWLRARSA
jgi:hypothetical protein